MSLEPLLFLLIIAAALGSAGGTIAWWLFWVWSPSKTAPTPSRPSSDGETDVDRLFAQAVRQILAYSSLPATQRSGQSDQISAMLGRLSLRMRELNRRGHERYDLRANEVSSMAAEAGIDWRAPSY
jgi:hypothetical protein